ncbi:hypothetical protein [Salinisphaera orenii]|uniref:hypothetical protein n=1 Tax=Salinisphaera orenii TaxID=856731 RepID=UPI000DBE2EA7
MAPKRITGEHPVYQTATWLIPSVLALGVLAGCGSSQPTGPSDARVKSDMLARVNKTHSGLLKTKHFEVDQRQVLGKDLVKFHVITAYQPDKQKIRHFKKVHGQEGHNAIFFAKRVGTGDSKLTIRYKQHGQKDWQIAHVYKGFQ